MRFPFGRGQDYFAGANRALDEVIGGWKISTAGVAWSGFPETLTGPGNNSNSYGNSRPNQYRPLKIVDRSLTNWFGTDPSATPCTQPGVDNGTCAFGVPAPNTFGTASNGPCAALASPMWTCRPSKTSTPTDEQAVGFRFDAFNAFNIVSYGNPDTGITDSTFGQIAPTGPDPFHGAAFAVLPALRVSSDTAAARTSGSRIRSTGRGFGSGNGITARGSRDDGTTGFRPYAS